MSSCQISVNLYSMTVSNDKGKSLVFPASWYGQAYSEIISKGYKLVDTQEPKSIDGTVIYIFEK